MPTPRARCFFSDGAEPPEAGSVSLRAERAERGRACRSPHPGVRSQLLGLDLSIERGRLFGRRHVTSQVETGGRRGQVAVDEGLRVGNGRFQALHRGNVRVHQHSPHRHPDDVALTVPPDSDHLHVVRAEDPWRRGRSRPADRPVAVARPRQGGRSDGRSRAWNAEGRCSRTGPDLLLSWWRGQDLNLRPSGYEASQAPVGPCHDVPHHAADLRFRVLSGDA
jgi:hypothetical protein